MNHAHNPAEEALHREAGAFVTSRKRFIVITRFLIFAIVAALAGREAAPEHLRIIYPVLGVFLFSNVFFLFQSAQRFETERTASWIFVFDTFFVTIFVVYLQARTTEFYLVYFLTIFIAASAKSAAAAFATSLVTAIIYGVLTRYGKTGVELNSLSFVLRVIFFFVTAMVVGYFAEQVKREREAREAAQHMLRLSGRLATLFDVSQRMVSTEDLKDLTGYLFESAVKVLGGESGSLMLLDEADRTLTIRESAGLPPDAKGQVIPLGKQVAGVVALEGKPVLLEGDISDNPSYDVVSSRRRISSAICAPLRIGERTLGVLNVNRGPGTPSFTEDDLRLLAALANHAAIVLEKARLHEQLAQAYDISKRRYEILVNTANAMIFTTDAAGVLTFVNRRGAEMLGLPAADLEGRSILDFVHPDDVAALKNTLHRVTATRESLAHLEYRVGGKNGSWQHHSASCSPLEDPAKGGCGLLVVAEDISDYILLQRRLAQSAKLASLGTMVEGIAHELNNPLMGVMGFAEILNERSDTKDLAAFELDMILRQANRCVQTVRGLLRFAKQGQAAKQPVDINQLLKECLDLRRDEVADGRIRLAEDYSPDLPIVTADPTQIQQVFLNIISNAFDAITETQRDGTLSVRTSHTDATVAIEFADDAGGMKDPEKVFDPFYTTKEVGKGAGLGLSVSYGIIAEHGGQIEARNSEKGAVFVVTLPIGSPDAEQDSASGAILQPAPVACPSRDTCPDRP